MIKIVNLANSDETSCEWLHLLTNGHFDNVIGDAASISDCKCLIENSR